MIANQHPLAWTTEDYDVSAAATPNRLNAARTVPHARGLSTEAQVIAFFARVGRGLGWFVVFALSILVLCQASDAGLLDGPNDLHPSGVVSRYGEATR